MKHTPVSSVMFHTIGVPDPQWTWSFLTTPWQQFEGMLQWYRRMGYRTVLLDEYKDLILTGKILKEKAVALTFDDGYADNWVYAAPLLEQYKACGTVFVSGDFINPSTEPRPQWHKNQEKTPLIDGFLNKGELCALDKKGILDVQSHCISHTWYPSGPRIVDFRHPNDHYHWMDWNQKPQDKWQYNQPPSRPETWGEPVYEHQKALAGPRYFPQEEVTTALRQHVATQVAAQGYAFFERPQWKENLFALAQSIEKDLPPGNYESEEAFAARVDDELGHSAHMLSSLLGKKVSWLCWPGGGYSDATFEAAAKYYQGTTIASASCGRIAQGIDAMGVFRFRRFGALHVGQGQNFRYQSPLTTCLYTEERRTANTAARLVRGALTRLNQWNIL